MSASPHIKCVSCGNLFTGFYCSLCGEKVVIKKERTIKHFLGQVFSAFTFADNKAWKTFMYLFTKPGILPKRFVQGQRKVFIAPLPFFLLINLIYFFINPLDTFNSRLVSQLGGQPYSGLIQGYAELAMQNSGLSQQVFESTYNSSSENISKSILLLFPILFAFPLWGLFHKRSSYLFDHLMLSISFMSFVLLGLLLLFPLLIIGLFYIIGQLGGAADFDWNGYMITLTSLTLFGIYLTAAIKNFYEVNLKRALLATAILLVAFAILMYLYRFILFFLTIWSI